VSRTILLEMCIMTLTHLSTSQLSELLPALTALAQPSVGTAYCSEELGRCIHDCLHSHSGIIEAAPQASAE